MAEIHKLTKENQLFYPATITDAVVHPQVRSSITKMFSTYNVSSLFPTSGLSKTDKYGLQEAIWKLTDILTDEEKIRGVKVGFLNSNREYEEWEYFGNGGHIFSDTAGWTQIDSSVLTDLMKTIYPLTINFNSDVNSILVGTMSTINFSWSIFRKGVDVTELADKIFNSVRVTGTRKSISETPSVSGNITYTLTVTYQGINEKISRIVRAVHPSYFGVVPSTWIPTDSNQLTQILSNMVTRADKNWTWDGIELKHERPCVAYPQYFGRLNSIRDGNSFEYLNSYTVYTDINIGNTPYYVYILTDPVTVSGFKQIYT